MHRVVGICGGAGSAARRACGAVSSARPLACQRRRTCAQGGSRMERLAAEELLTPSLSRARALWPPPAVLRAECVSQCRVRTGHRGRYRLDVAQLPLHALGKALHMPCAPAAQANSLETQSMQLSSRSRECCLPLARASTYGPSVWHLQVIKQICTQARQSCMYSSQAAALSAAAPPEYGNHGRPALGACPGPAALQHW